MTDQNHLSAEKKLTAFAIEDICSAYMRGKQKGQNPYPPGSNESLAFLLGSDAVQITSEKRGIDKWLLTAIIGGGAWMLFLVGLLIWTAVRS